jgi:hypothetical protein
MTTVNNQVKGDAPGPGYSLSKALSKYCCRGLPVNSIKNTVIKRILRKYTPPKEYIRKKFFRAGSMSKECIRKPFEDFYSALPWVAYCVNGYAAKRKDKQG